MGPYGYYFVGCGEHKVHLSRLSRFLFSQSLNKLELASRLPDLKVSKTEDGVGGEGSGGRGGDCLYFSGKKITHLNRREEY